MHLLFLCVFWVIFFKGEEFEIQGGILLEIAGINTAAKICYYTDLRRESQHWFRNQYHYNIHHYYRI